MSNANVIPGKRMVAATFWQVDPEGNRVGPEVRVPIPPGQDEIRVPPEFANVPMGWFHYRLHVEGE